MRRRTLLATILALFAPLSRDGQNALPISSAHAEEPPAPGFVSWPVFGASRPGLPALSGHTNTVPDIVGRIGGGNDLVIFTEGNHFPVLLGGEVLPPFRAWAKAEPRFADLRLEEIALVTLPQPIIVAMIRQGGLRLGNAVVEVSAKSGFFPDIVMGGDEPLRELRRAGLLRPEARVFARNKGLSLLVRKGNPLGLASVQDLARPEARIVMASASEPGARNQYTRALREMIGEDALKNALARETVTFDGRLGIQHRDVVEALAKNHANVGIIFNHLAQYYARTFPELVQAIEVPGAERFSSTIAFTTTLASPHPRAASAFEEFFFGVARSLYPRYGFAAMSAEEFDQKLDLGSIEGGR